MADSSTSGNIRAYMLSNNNVICDVCGRKRKRSECALAYGTGDIAVVMSCLDGCADTRHPLNSPPPIIFDGQPVHDPRPEGSDTFVNAIAQTSLMTWGAFPAAADRWSHMNGLNNEFQTNPIWTWGAFSRF